MKKSILRYSISLMVLVSLQAHGAIVSEPSMGITMQFVSAMKISSDLAHADEMNHKMHDLLPNLFFYESGIKKYSAAFFNKFKYHAEFIAFESPFRLRRVSRSGKLFEV